MKQFTAFAAIIALLSFALSGCSSSSTEPADSGPSATANDHNGDHAHDGDGQSDMDKMKAELAKLSPEDAVSAEKQHICPVSGKRLGTMGAPQKVDVDGRSVWICCAGCEDTLLDSPAEYLAKLQE